MSEELDSLNDKEKALLKLLKKDPELGMKEANIQIREKFDTGISGVGYKKVKSIFEESASKKPKAKKESKEKDKAPKAKKERKASLKKPKNKGDSKAEETPITEEANEKTSNSNRLSEERQKTKESPSSDKNTTPAPLSPIATAQEAEGSEEESSTPKHPVTLKLNCPEAKSVHLAGSFNRWRRDQLELLPNPEQEGEWIFNDALPEGDHTFKFIINKTHWHLDFDRDFVTDITGVSHPLKVGESSNGES